MGDLRRNAELIESIKADLLTELDLRLFEKFKVSDTVQPVVFLDTSLDGKLSVSTSVGIRDEDHAMSAQAATVATRAQLRPATPKILYLYAIWIIAGAFAANRTFYAKRSDGTNEFTMQTNAQSIPSGSVRQIWPEKGADDDLYTMPPFPVTNAYYVVIEDNMVAAETATLYFDYVHRSSEL